MNIQIKTIEHKDQEYPTVGNWKFTENGDLNIYISNMKNVVFEWLVAEHEINEALMCQRDGIQEKVVSDFDKTFEDLRVKFPEMIGSMEPGDMTSAPYHEQHFGASLIEKMSASLHKIDWKEYTKAIEEL